MAVAIQSYGYPAVFDELGEVVEGAIDSSIGARYWPRVGASRFSVVGADDWKVTAQVGIDRGIRVNAGTIIGDAVMDVLPTYDTFSLPAVTDTRWFLVVARRSWGEPAVTKIEFIPGTATKALPVRSDDPGFQSDQPIALCLVSPTSAQVVQIVDLRCYANTSGVIALDSLSLEYLKAPAAIVRVGNTTKQFLPTGNGLWDWEIIAGPRHIEFWTGNNGFRWDGGGRPWDIGPLSIDTNYGDNANFAIPGSLSGSIKILQRGYYISGSISTPRVNVDIGEAGVILRNGRQDIITTGSTEGYIAEIPSTTPIVLFEKDEIIRYSAFSVRGGICDTRVRLDRVG